MEISRRDFLSIATGAIAAIGTSSIPTTLANIPSPKHLQINSYTAQRTIWLYCDPHGNLPKLYSGELSEFKTPEKFAQIIKKYSEVYPLNKWHELKKQYPNAFTRSFPTTEKNTVETDAQYIVENELADRIYDYYLPQLMKMAPKNISQKLWITRNYFFPKVREELMEQKIPNNLGKDNKYDEYHEYLIKNPGVFTNYTEDNANDLVQKLTTTPVNALLEDLNKKHGWYFNKVN